MLRLSDEQHHRILTQFQTHTSGEAAHGWSRRQYAPMHIHTPPFLSLRRAIREALPEYTIAFDVVFETPADRGVDFHCDYESLGPFVSPSSTNVFESSFVSVHFTLTPRGGRLVTLDWPWLSALHAWVIGTSGLYSRIHTALNRLCDPLFRHFGKVHSNEPNRGNVFDNMRLHGVTPGRERVSYVVRLIRRGGGVWLKRESVLACRSLSSACDRLTRVLLPRLPDKRAWDAAEFPWHSLVSTDASADTRVC